MQTIDDIAAAVAQLQRENAALRAQIEALRIEASQRGGGRTMPIALIIAIVVASTLALMGNSATARAGSGQTALNTPFEVDDAAGFPVMRVTDQGVFFQSYKHNLVAQLLLPDSGGQLILRKGKAAPSVILEATSTSNPAGFGGLFQMNYAGNPRVLLGFSDTGEAQLALQAATGNTTALLAQKQAGGYLGLENMSGTARVEAGVLPGDNGIVRAYGPSGKIGYIEGK